MPIDLILAARMLGAFAVIAAVLFGLQFVARVVLRQRLATPGTDARLISVLETTALPNAAALHVVRIGESHLLIGRSGSHIATLADIPQHTIDAWRETHATLAPSSRLLESFRARIGTWKRKRPVS